MILAEAAGIESGYWDGLGARRELQESTAAALLSALDIPSAHAHSQRDVLSDAAFLRPLPSCVVVRLQPPLSMVVALPFTLRESTLTWELTLENGQHLRGDFVAANLTQLEEREIEGTRYGRFTLPLPDSITPGYHHFFLPPLACDAPFIAGPARCYIPESIARGQRHWGLAIQLYALRSSRNWGIGDFGDLAVLVVKAGHAGAAFAGLNPLHARHLSRPDEASPYSPSSRLFLDSIYIDIEDVEDLPACPEARAAIEDPQFAGKIAATRMERLVNYPLVLGLKLLILRILFRSFLQHKDDPENSRANDYRVFRDTGGESLLRFAEFEAYRLYLQEVTGRTAPWPEWAQAFRTPGGSGMQQFRIDGAELIEFQVYLQWLAAVQLRKAARAGRMAGMAIGLYCDLAVGAAADSAEAWSEPHIFAHGVSIGAPPDMLNRQGQAWGLTPWKPRELAREGYAPLRKLLAANMRTAGALRIDHVMALTRLFWIPAGMHGDGGGYIRMPLEDMAAIVALESLRNRCMIIGEDLGAVPDGLRARLQDWGFLSYRVMVYERHWQGDGRFCRPEEYSPQSLAIVATHDMPTMTEFWCGGDIARRAALGMVTGQQQHDEDLTRRQAEREGLLRLLGDIGRSPGNPTDAADVIEALHAAIAQTHSSLAVVQLDDLIGEVEPINIPGTDREYPNWRRKLTLTIEEISGSERWSRLTMIMREAGRC